jgi:hypothetical protein
MDDAKSTDRTVVDGYETPALTEFGSIEEWTKGRYAADTNVSIIF